MKTETEPWAPQAPQEDAAPAAVEPHAAHLSVDEGSITADPATGRPGG